MSTWNLIYLFAFLGGAILSLLLTPVFQWIARRTGFLDVPQANHKGHRQPTPLLGGAAMFTSWILCIGAGLAVIHWFRIPFFTTAIAEHLPGLRNTAAGPLFFVALGAFLAMLLGLIDDRRALSAGAKFSGQFLIAALAAILLAVIVYGVLALALRMVTREDLALLPKGEKIAKILHIR